MKARPPKKHANNIWTENVQEENIISRKYKRHNNCESSQLKSNNNIFGITYSVIPTSASFQPTVEY